MTASKLLTNIRNSAPVGLLTVLFSTLNFFSEVKAYLNGWWKVLSVESETWQKILTVFTILLASFILARLTIFITSLPRRNRPRLVDYTLEPRMTLSSDSSGERIESFRKIRVESRQTLFIMGIGMTFFSQDKSLLLDLLERKRFIRLLIMDPDILKPGNQDLFVSDKTFDGYYDRDRYCADLASSFARLQSIIREAMGALKLMPGQIELRKYREFLPINFTISDEDDTSSKMLFEWAMPFSDNRMRIAISRKGHGDAYKSIMGTAERLWKRSATVIKS